MLSFEKSYEENVLTVKLDGKLDTGSTPELTAALEGETEKAERIVIDMADLKYISSAGLRLILSLHKQMSGKGGLAIRNVNETNMEIFEFTGFADILDIG